MAKNTTITARKLAGQLWGEVQGQTKLCEGAWMFECSGHGGIIIDNNVFPQTKKWNTPVATRKNSCYGYVDEQHFSAFEEDCDWAIAEYLLFDQLVNKRLYAHHATDLTFEEWKDRERTFVNQVLCRWYPDFAAENGIAA